MAFISTFIDPRVPVGLEDTSMYPYLLAGLIESEVEWTDDDLGKLASGNLIRAMREMEQVRDTLSFLAPVQEIIPEADFEEDEKACMSEM